MKLAVQAKLTATLARHVVFTLESLTGPFRDLTEKCLDTKQTLFYDEASHGCCFKEMLLLLQELRLCAGSRISTLKQQHQRQLNSVRSFALIFRAIKKEFVRARTCIAMTTHFA